MKLTQNDYMMVFFLHLLLCGFITLLIALFYRNNFKQLIKNKKLTQILLLSIIGAIFAVVLGYYFYFRAISKTNNITLVVLIVYILPILIVSILGRLILKEKLNLGMILGLFVSIIGIAIFTIYSKIQ
jgi:drug/metabolite transporter (DMT)-like permease